MLRQREIENLSRLNDIEKESSNRKTSANKFELNLIEVVYQRLHSRLLLLFSMNGFHCINATHSELFITKRWIDVSRNEVLKWKMWFCLANIQHLNRCISTTKIIKPWNETHKKSLVSTFELFILGMNLQILKQIWKAWLKYMNH